MNLFKGNTEYKNFSTEELIKKLSEDISSGPKSRIIITLGSRIDDNASLEKIILSEAANKKNQIQYVMGVFNISIICALVIIQCGTDIGKQNLENIINDWDNNPKQILKDYLDMEGIEWDVKI